MGFYVRCNHGKYECCATFETTFASSSASEKFNSSKVSRFFQFHNQPSNTLFPLVEHQLSIKYLATKISVSYTCYEKLLINKSAKKSVYFHILMLIYMLRNEIGVMFADELNSQFLTTQLFFFVVYGRTFSSPSVTSIVLSPVVEWGLTITFPNRNQKMQCKQKIQSRTSLINKMPSESDVKQRQFN